MDKDKFVIRKMNLDKEVFIIRRENDRSILSRLKIYECMKNGGYESDSTFLETIETVGSLCEKFNCVSNGILSCENEDDISKFLKFLHEKELI